MKYDFTTIMDRRGKDAIAVDRLGDGSDFAPDAPKDGFDPVSYTHLDVYKRQALPAASTSTTL